MIPWTMTGHVAMLLAAVALSPTAWTRLIAAQYLAVNLLNSFNRQSLSLLFYFR